MKHYYVIGVAAALKPENHELSGRTRTAVTTFGINEKSQVLSLLQLSCQVNDATLHCFVLDEELEDPEDFFDKFVDLANSDNDLKKKLLESRIF